MLKGGVTLKQYYQQMISVTSIDSSDTAGLDLDLEEFENDLNKILMVRMNEKFILMQQVLRITVFVVWGYINYWHISLLISMCVSIPLLILDF